MPHDKHNRAIETGDGARFVDWNSRSHVGVVKAVFEAAACNVEFAVPVVGGCVYFTVNADQCEVLTKADGTPIELAFG